MAHDRDQLVVLAVGDPEVSVGVERADVAGVEPSVGVDRVVRAKVKSRSISTTFLGISKLAR